MDIICKESQCFNETLVRHIALKNNNEISAILKDGNSSQLTDSSGATLLHIAASHGNAWFVRYLIDLGANVDAQDNQQETPLMFAIKNNHHKVVKTLLKCNADLYIPDQQGESALKIAQNFEFNDIFQTVENYVTSESLRRSKHASNQFFHIHFPLHHFVALQEVDLIQTLLENGSPIDAKTADGAASLHLAVEDMNFQMVELLLKYGADINEEGFPGFTPLSYINMDNLEKHDEVPAMIELLLKAGAVMIDTEKQRIFIAEMLSVGNKKTIHCLLQYQLDLHYEDNYGYTPLHYLAQNKHPDILEELRDFNFDINISTKIEQTMLHKAAINGNVSSVKFLLERNADFNVPCVQGFTLLQIMLICSEKIDLVDNYVKCIEVLLAYGADSRILTIQNKNIFSSILYGDVTNPILKLMDPVLAYLCLIEGLSQEYTYKEIQTTRPLKNMLVKKEEERERMRQIGLGSSITLLDFLRATDKTVSLYARNQNFISISNKAMKNYSLDPSYEFKLQRNFSNYRKLFELRKTAISTVDIVLTETLNISMYTVARKVVEFLEDHELNVLL